MHTCLQEKKRSLTCHVWVVGELLLPASMQSTSITHSISVNTNTYMQSGSISIAHSHTHLIYLLITWREMNCRLVADSRFLSQKIFPPFSSSSKGRKKTQNGSTVEVFDSSCSQTEYVAHVNSTSITCSGGPTKHTVTAQP